MIQPNELRINNWILKDGEYYKIELTEEEFNPLWYNDEYDPIPLTSEILEKCGFEEKQEGFNWFYARKYMHVLIERKFELQYLEEGLFTWMQGSTIVHLRYLHQLQNLYFALTNTELEIAI